jgi:hypothetical protein
VAYSHRVQGTHEATEADQNVCKCCISKHLSDNFPIQNVLKQDALMPLRFNFALEYAFRKSRKTRWE